jgi:hypothetical protein
MKTYFVFVTFKQENATGGYRRVRYIDSQWADESHAEDRKSELASCLSMFSVPDWVITIMAGTVVDAALQPTPIEGSEEEK